VALIVLLWWLMCLIGRIGRPDQTHGRLKFLGDLQYDFAILGITGVCRRAQAASPSGGRAENKMLQIDRSRTAEQYICPLLDHSCDFAGGFRFLGHQNQLECRKPVQL
jgi:hypothetical protein